MIVIRINGIAAARVKTVKNVETPRVNDWVVEALSFFHTFQLQGEVDTVDVSCAVRPTKEAHR